MGEAERRRITRNERLREDAGARGRSDGPCPAGVSRVGSGIRSRLFPLERAAELAVKGVGKGLELPRPPAPPFF